MVKLLHGLNVLAAAALGVLGLQRLLTLGQGTGIILFGALIVAGPVEDLLVQRLVEVLPEGDRTYQLVDKSTSLVLIVGMIAATLI